MTITCSCKICLTNGHGRALSAVVPPTLTPDAYSNARGRHGVVYMANDPSIIGVAGRAATGVKAG